VTKRKAEVCIARCYVALEKDAVGYQRLLRAPITELPGEEILSFLGYQLGALVAAHHKGDLLFGGAISVYGVPRGLSQFLRSLMPATPDHALTMAAAWRKVEEWEDGFIAGEEQRG